jgi:hypothetical protein
VATRFGRLENHKACELENAARRGGSDQRLQLRWIEKMKPTPEQLNRPVRSGDIPNLMAAVAEAIAESLGQRIIALEREIAELKSSALKYCGVWCSNKTYAPNSMTTHQGGAWISQIETCGLRPGDGNSAWRLAVKRGSK